MMDVVEAAFYNFPERLQKMQISQSGLSGAHSPAFLEGRNEDGGLPLCI